MPPKDRKVAVVGMTRMLTESTIMVSDPTAQCWSASSFCSSAPPLTPLHRPSAFTAMVKLFSEPQHLTKSTTDDDPDAGLTAIDFEEQNAGYQAAYSRLAAAAGAQEDPVAYVPDPTAFLGQKLAEAAPARPRVRELVKGADQAVVGPFLAAVRGAGINI
jgi:exportin-2 (importin alpha re-exporter)